MGTDRAALYDQRIQTALYKLNVPSRCEIMQNTFVTERLYMQPLRFFLIRTHSRTQENGTQFAQKVSKHSDRQRVKTLDESHCLI
jgi:hypothetical protein